ncbi:hypothetical protein RN001_014846 [Aquatica leii]|uniref:Amino acid transporter transmembrane domain-containing protein n=1 Tax=Aquatica leii TaxID=1421715 RepID=A0AAN7NYB1_9COLE|nr:hypothetical protein RN001_014846 [Aquatica leii]
MTEQHVNPAFVFDEKYIKKIDNNDTYQIELKDSAKSKNLDDFDPYLHRQVEHPTTNSETFFHLIKGCLGTGILAMPKAFSNSGYAFGIGGTLFIGVICIYCIHILIKSEYELCKRRKIGSLSFPATAEAAFNDGPIFFKKLAPISPHVVNAFVLTYELGTCCVYVIFIAANIRSVANVYIRDLGIEVYMAIFLLPLIFINWIRNLKRLAPLSTAANAISFVSFAIILYYIFHNGVSVEGKETVGKFENIPLFFGTVLFALEAVGVIMPLENEMKTPQSFGGTFGVLNIGLSVVLTLYLGMGLLGYLAYGALVEGSITLNLPDEDILAQILKVILALVIFITYTIQYYVAIDITWNQYLGPILEGKPMRAIWEYATRTVLVLITFVLAVSVPALDLFISLFGALCLSALGITIPAAVETSTYWYSRTGLSFYIMLVKNLFLIIFSVFGLVAGTYISIHDIIQEFS